MSAKTDASSAPFDADRLDRLLDEAGIDLLLASSKHNVSYLLGGYKYFFFESMDAIGTSRYLPIFIYVKGDPARSHYVGNAMEADEARLGRFWTASLDTSTWGTQDAISKAIQFIDRCGLKHPRVGIEASFLPADAYMALAAKFGTERLVDAFLPLERLRAVKSERELQFLRSASDLVAASMIAAFASAKPNVTTRELADAVKFQEIDRGLNHEYCLVSCGTGFNRSPGDQPWTEGTVASLDSGGNLNGYLGDLCRMGVMGDPDPELEDLLGEIDGIQQSARRLVRPGVLGGDVFAAGAARVAASDHKGYTHFLAHGMGLVSHEAPRLTASGPVPYEGVDAAVPLQAGMVLSIETTMLHPRRGFIKLEDTVAVTADGHEAFGDAGRGWNRADG